ncbi:hypothetical protein HanIR_Chr04g0169631 [Helianthus annuus]|nr:hypothetical protein HanIR_Chr04g0169631 [Helianthus annuus]
MCMWTNVFRPGPDRPDRSGRESEGSPGRFTCSDRSCIRPAVWPVTGGSPGDPVGEVGPVWVLLLFLYISTATPIPATCFSGEIIIPVTSISGEKVCRT